MKTQMENLIPGNFVSARERAVLMGKSGTPPHTHTKPDVPTKDSKR